MQRSMALVPNNAQDFTVRDLMESRNAGEDPRRTIARLNACIVDCQSTGVDVPPSFLRLSRTLAAACVAQHQAR